MNIVTENFFFLPNMRVCQFSNDNGRCAHESDYVCVEHEQMNMNEEKEGERERKKEEESKKE